MLHRARETRYLLTYLLIRRLQCIQRTCMPVNIGLGTRRVCVKCGILGTKNVQTVIIKLSFQAALQSVPAKYVVSIVCSLIYKSNRNN